MNGSGVFGGEHWDWTLAVWLAIGLQQLSLGLQRVRTRRALLAIVERGEVRVLGADGGPLTGAALVAALDTEARRSAWPLGRDRKLLGVDVFIAAGIAGVVAAALANRGMSP